MPTSETPPDRQSIDLEDAETVQKVIAYVTNEAGELLVFEGPGHDGLRVPVGTVDSGETPREALFRRVAEEAGLGAVGDLRPLTTDVWVRRREPPRLYVRHFFHLSTSGKRAARTHTVDCGKLETGTDDDFTWVELPADRSFALDLDDYLQLVR